ncbi:MAG: alpha-L-fucosidase [Gemmatimonadaceae bacterium]
MHRRHFLHLSAMSVAGGLALAPRRVLAAAARPVPSPAQLAWQQDELAMFLHFGVNTFTDREWGDGSESPGIFDPARLDARQWARSAKAAGFRALVLTAKHHDGFCLWPTRTTEHSVASSPFRSGTGDVVREFVDACRAEGLKAGLYLSPWDRNHPAYGDSPRYNDVYQAQLTELLTNYGTISDVWFDGANGEGPNGKRQVYDWPRTWATVRRLQPQAVIFSDAGPDVRWCGNERGSAGDPNWSTVDPGIVTYPGADGPTIVPSLQHGDPAGSVWRPAEADVSIRPGWFHHAAEDAKVRTTDNLVDLYCSSVGRNSKLLLNVPPTRDGLLHDTDVARLLEFRTQRDALLRQGAHKADDELDFGAVVTISAARLAERIATGQRVARYTLERFHDGAWTTLTSGTTIGYARIERFPPTPARRLRVRVDEAVDAPGRVSIEA